MNFVYTVQFILVNLFKNDLLLIYYLFLFLSLHFFGAYMLNCVYRTMGEKESQKTNQKEVKSFLPCHFELEALLPPLLSSFVELQNGRMTEIVMVEKTWGCARTKRI